MDLKDSKYGFHAYSPLRTHPSCITDGAQTVSFTIVEHHLIFFGVEGHAEKEIWRGEGW
jgi:hypothetical protein